LQFYSFFFFFKKKKKKKKKINEEKNSHDQNYFSQTKKKQKKKIGNNFFKLYNVYLLIHQHIYHNKNPGAQITQSRVNFYVLFIKLQKTRGFFIVLFLLLVFDYLTRLWQSILYVG